MHHKKNKICEKKTNTPNKWKHVFEVNNTFNLGELK